MSLTPRVCNSVSTCSQNLAPSFALVHKPSTSFVPSSVAGPYQPWHACSYS
jgi:hypothetical protein